MTLKPLETIPRSPITSSQTEAKQQSPPLFPRLRTFWAFSPPKSLLGRMFFDVGLDMMRVDIRSDLDNQALAVELDDVAELVPKVLLYRTAASAITFLSLSLSLLFFVPVPQPLRGRDPQRNAKRKQLVNVCKEERKKESQKRKKKLTMMALSTRLHLHRRPGRLPAADDVDNLQIDGVVLAQHAADAHLDVLHPGVLAAVVARELVVEAADVPDEVGGEVLAVLGDRLPAVAQLEDLLDLVGGRVGGHCLFCFLVFGLV